MSLGRFSYILQLPPVPLCYCTSVQRSIICLGVWLLNLPGKYSKSANNMPSCIHCALCSRSQTDSVLHVRHDIITSASPIQLTVLHRSSMLTECLVHDHTGEMPQDQELGVLTKLLASRVSSAGFSTISISYTIHVAKRKL